MRYVCASFLKVGNANSRIQLISPIAPALIVPRPSAIPAIPLGSASSSAPSPELFQRSVSYLNPTLVVMVLICQRSSIYHPDLPLHLPPENKLSLQNQRLYTNLVGPCGSSPGSVSIVVQNTKCNGTTGQDLGSHTTACIETTLLSSTNI